MNKDVFNSIYVNNLWNGKSGPGSIPSNATEWTNTVNSFLAKEDVKTVLDVGCGDWRLGQLLNLENKEYTGVDVSSVILDEIMHYSSPNIKFVCEDIETMNIPKTDLILIKDVLMHLPYSSIKNIMKNVMENAKYVLICNDYQNINNKDIVAGAWRPLDLLKDPFNYDVKNIAFFKSAATTKVISLYHNLNYDESK